MQNEPTVFVVDDDAAVRDALFVLFKSARLKCECWASAEEFLAAYVPMRRGCLVLDVRMTGMDGLELMRELAARKIQIPIVFISGHGDIQMAVRAMQSGAVSFIEKPFDEEELLRQVARAMQLDAQRRQTETQQQATRERFDTLSAREKQVLDLIVAGLINKEIAYRLGITLRTVETHRAQVMSKMGAETSADLVRLLASAGLL